jgi:hypothetical protein
MTPRFTKATYRQVKANNDTQSPPSDTSEGSPPDYTASSTIPEVNMANKKQLPVVYPSKSCPLPAYTPPRKSPQAQQAAVTGDKPKQGDVSEGAESISEDAKNFVGPCIVM